MTQMNCKARTKRKNRMSLRNKKKKKTFTEKCKIQIR